MLNNSRIWHNYPALRGFLEARYLLLLMGVFAVYCGFIYNDFMSIPLNLFGSCYTEKGNVVADCVYPFGVDPKWYISTRELAFMNSFKMKYAVIIGVLQMELGVF